jgi:hypothetical protein
MTVLPKEKVKERVEKSPHGPQGGQGSAPCPATLEERHMDRSLTGEVREVRGSDQD